MNIIEEKWVAILNKLKENYDISEISFLTWIQPLKVYSVEGNTVTVLVPSLQLGLEYVNMKYKCPLQKAICEVAGLDDCEVIFILPEGEQISVIKSPTNIYEDASDVRAEEVKLDPNHTFDNFVVDDNNRFAYAATRTVAETPGIYNPLFIYGGLGKTHLMHSIANFIIENEPKKKVLYVTGESFTEELIEAIRSGNYDAMRLFHDKFRNADFLLFDDIQYIIGKKATQEEFSYIFNALHAADKQIVISADKPPKDMGILDEGLHSRFEGGLIAGLTSSNEMK